MDKKLLMIGVFVLFLSIANISAAIYYSPVKDYYSLGEIINLNVSIEPVIEGKMLIIELLCNEKELIEFVNYPINGSVNLQIPLSSSILKNTTGTCYLAGGYDNIINKKTTSFQISKGMEVFLDTETFFANPGDTIDIKGSAKKTTGQGVNGEIQINIPSLAYVGSNAINSSNVSGNIYYGRVIDGSFSIPIFIASNAAANDYVIYVKINEEYAGELSNTGERTANLKIFQIMKNAEIVIDTSNVDPGTNFNFKPVLYDQSGGIFNTDVSVIISNSYDNRVFEKITKSSEIVEYSMPTDLAPGYYTIVISTGSINATKKIYVNEKPLASFEVINGTLIVKNIGNVKYNKEIEVEIEGKKFIRSVNLGLGESNEFRLTGPGSYDVKVNDGENQATISGVSLTGKAIDVKGTGSMAGLFFTTPIVWIFLIILLIAFIVFYFRDIFKRKSIAYPAEKRVSIPFREVRGKNIDLAGGKPQLKLEGIVAKRKELEKEKEIQKTNIHPIKKEIVLHSNKSVPVKAEQVLVVSGDKSKAAIVGIKIKNRIPDYAKEAIENAISSAYSKKAVIYEQGNNVFVIFTSLVTKTMRNEVIASKFAEDVINSIELHNKKSPEKIEFGIGINSGDIVNKVEGTLLKFTTIGNIIPIVKKLADLSEGKILLSSQSYHNAMSEISASKRVISGFEFYEVKRVVDYEKNKKFIQEFMKREKINRY